MKVSKLLNLKPIPKDAGRIARKKAYLDRVLHLKRLLNKGGMSPKLTQRCEEYIRSAEYRIRQIDKQKVERQPESKQVLAKVERQGYLPNFLGQLDNVRIEELVAEKIFERIATRIDSAVESLFKKAGSDE